MTEDEARQLNEHLLDFVAAQPGGAGFVRAIDDNVEFVTEPVMMHFLVSNGRDMTSAKAPNVRFNLKGVLLTGVPLALATEMPTTLHALALVCLSVICFIDEVGSVALSDSEANMVTYLHLRDGYVGVAEEDLLRDYPAWHKEHAGEDVGEGAIRRTLESLEAIRTVEVEGGTVYLRERVLFRV